MLFNDLNESSNEYELKLGNNKLDRVTNFKLLESIKHSR